MTEAAGQEAAKGVSPEAQAAIDKRMGELVAERKAAEARAEAAERARQAEHVRLEKLERTIDERLPPKKDPEPEWTDPAEKALARVERLEAELARRDAAEKTARDDAERKQVASAAIDKAVATYKFEDEEEAREALARGYFANRHLGLGFDADAEARRIIERQQARTARKDEAAKAERKRETAEATASAMTTAGGVSVGVPRSDEIPKWGTPERKAWEVAEAAQLGFKGGLAR